MEMIGQLHVPDALPPGKEPLVPTVKQAGWAPDSRNIIRVIKSRRMTWVGNEARHMTDENAYKILVAKLRGKKPFRRIILKWTLSMIGGCRMDSSGSEKGPVAISCEHGNEMHKRRGIYYRL
jgi:hypothetical protein